MRKIVCKLPFIPNFKSKAKEKKQNNVIALPILFYLSFCSANRVNWYHQNIISKREKKKEKEKEKEKLSVWITNAVVMARKKQSDNKYNSLCFHSDLPLGAKFNFKDKKDNRYEWKYKIDKHNDKSE